jgi:ATP-binding cassette subfamily B multidrug efflux pump
VKDLRALARFLAPYRGKALFALAMLMAMVVLDLAIPRLVERVIDEGIRGGDMRVVLWTSAVMIAVSLLSVAAAVLNSNASVRVGESVARDLREALFSKIQTFSHGDLDRFSTGKLMVRLASDTGAAQRLVQSSLRIGTRAPLTMAGSIALMFVTSPELAASMIPILLASAALIVLFGLKMEPIFREAQQRLDRLNSVLQESISGARLVKAFVRGEREAARFEAANRDLTERTMRVMKFTSSMTPILNILVEAGIVLVVWIGGRRAIEGRMSLGQIVAFTSYLLATAHPLGLMTQLSNTWANGIASAKRINEILGAETSVAEAPSPVALEGDGPCSVSFRDVDFRYDVESGAPVLEAIRFAAEPGRTVAILGATGSGKSSLVSLIPRFYDPERGTVLVNGVDLRIAGRHSLLERIAVVPQETILFSGTIRDNIRYGRPDAVEEEVVAAAQAAQAHDFILRLHRGYDTRVEERGVNLSGGQKQRIAIARAIITRPSLLILDDSTSSVDVETENRIQTALRSLLSGCTVFVVAQRISTVLNADKIIVLDEGRIAAEGTHRELLESSAIYREIYDSQLGGGIRG